MAKFSKEMMALCAKTLKFLNPYLEKSASPDFVMPASALNELQNQMKQIVDLFMQSSPAVKQEFRAIADDVDGLYRIGDLIKQSQDGLIKISMKTTLSDVQKRLVGIKVILNRGLGAAPKKRPWGTILVLLILLAAGWFFKGTIMSLVSSFTSKPEVQQEAEETEVGGEETEAEEAAPDDAESEAEPEEPEAVEPEVTEPEEEAETDADSEAKAAEDDSEKEVKADEKKKEKKKKSKKSAKKGANRTWRDINGNSMKGRFERFEEAPEFEESLVFLEVREKNGKKTSKGFVFKNFSEKDQEYIRGLLEE